MEMLSVRNLNKRYEKFALKNISICLKKGYIMGFIGRNGAGKTTTLKAILDLAHRDSGEVEILGKEVTPSDFSSKQKMGFIFGGVDYFPKKKLKIITDVTKKFYENWDDKIYQQYLKRFELDEEKTIDQLSEGMKVKYALSLALSHHAQLLILDEPTSGLDPVSRDDLVELFQELIEDGEKSILFSTHITSDLEKCADYITYIKNGEIIASDEKDQFIDSYRLLKGSKEQLKEQIAAVLIGCKVNSLGFSALVKTVDLPSCEGIESEKADLETIMIYFERKQAQ
ncbi:MAG: ABC transporter ATP-binding protein [Christensenellaceae bacterium]